MSVVAAIRKATAEAIAELYSQQLTAKEILVNETKPEFEGDYTVVLFSFVRQLKLSPDALGKQLGEHLLQRNPALLSAFNVIKGFLNLTVSDSYWTGFLDEEYANPAFGRGSRSGKKVMVEYASPNTNKPLHLGHLRNIFLGWSTAEILKFTGNDVVKTCIVNDRGIHICKSMIAWKLFGNDATPQGTGIKGDHLVGDYYVRFNDEYKKEVDELVYSGMPEDEAGKQAPIMKAAQKMLIDWEAGDPEVIDLWQRMNNWVYQGFDETYQRIGADFDKVYYESNTYLLGKGLVEKGLQKGVFYRKDDGSVWIDLTADGLDEKVVQRRDGTAVYITQDIGLAEQRHEEFGAEQNIYVIGDEQNYHMKVLKLICQKLGLPSADGIYHLSYGMVELPTGKMKSREGTVVDADDIVSEMVNIARQKTEELGKVKDFSDAELTELYDIIGLGALKFFLLRVDPKKKMVFNPEESIDFHGFTGPFIQYTHARIRSIIRKVESAHTLDLSDLGKSAGTLLPLEKQMIVSLEKFPAVAEEAGAELNPSKIAVYIFNLAQVFNSFYTAHSVANAETEEKRKLRLKLAMLTVQVINSGMAVLGIRVPDRM
ncbi:MAG TPA: arginine--tRNA ligase [Chitinophagaceae bacterium]